MNSFFLGLLFLSIISIQLTSSASFPNPPQFPSPNASADEWTLFWKLLHNYYAIIARPRFGKRYDSVITEEKNPSYFRMIPSNENFNEQHTNMGEFYTFIHPDRRRRRQR